jgi:UDP-N-acetylenolpyruvoylglucosamine reductase
MENEGMATADDFLQMVHLVQQEVLLQFGVPLELEVKI